jgi:PLP dependent protein
MNHDETLASKLHHLHQEINDLAKKCGRDPSSIQLMCVSKKATTQEMVEAIELGEKCFGENYIQDALPKIETIQQRYLNTTTSQQKPEFCFIGHLQKNKAKKAIPFFQRIDSVDSIKIATTISTTIESLVKENAYPHEKYPYPILLEIKTTHDTTKFGITPQNVPLVIESILKLKHLQIQGFMTMAPWTKEENEIRKSFSMLRTLKEEMESKYRIPFPVLSMGMTNDYPYAIQEGSTLLRIGSAIFGGSQ